MMTPTRWALVLVLGWLLAAVPAQAGRKPKPAPEQIAAPAEPEVVVDGYGENPDKARELALDRACKRVEKLLLERLGNSGYLPPREQLDPEFLATYRVLQPRGEPESTVMQGEKLVVARYGVQLTPEYLRKVAETARDQKVQERHLLFARVLAAILAVCLVVAGYLRLDEWTRGYASKLLRLAAVLILAVIGLGLLVVG
ncbi:MAG: hypothetical protein U0840_08965 [Gemmataceae bacterium]